MFGLHVALTVLAAIAAVTIGSWISLFLSSDRAIATTIFAICVAVTAGTAVIEWLFNRDGHEQFLAGYAGLWLVAFVISAISVWFVRGVSW